MCQNFLYQATKQRHSCPMILNLSRFLLAITVWSCVMIAPVLAAPDRVKAFIYGNSLVHHLTDSDETTVPYWVDFFADANGQSFAIDGQWGFLRNFATDFPPIANWSFRGVQSVWDSDNQPFGRAGFDHVMITPANFIQYQGPDLPYEGDNPENASPLSATLQIIDQVTATGSAPKFLLYEGWPEMAGVARRFPPSARDLRRYHKFTQTQYHDWFVNYHEELLKARPDLKIQLVPVATVLAKLFKDTELSKISAEDLYQDEAPHGTANLYFLAGAITYAALFDSELPNFAELPESLHPLIAANWQDIRALISIEIAVNQQALAAPLKAEPLPEVPQSEDVEVPVQVTAAPKITKPIPTRVERAPALGLSNPSLAMGLNGIADWSTQQPFIDYMKSARPWVGHKGEQWGSMLFKEIVAQGALDDQGWPKFIPDGANALETLFLTNQPEAATALNARYRLTYEGSGKIIMTGRVRRTKYSDGEIWFDYTSGEGLVGIRLNSTDPENTGDYIRNIHVVREDQIELAEVGAIFNPDWIKRVADARSVRFMDWMFTNGSPATDWNSRPRYDDFTWGWRGAPVEVMVALANEISADPWFNMPHMATDDYMAEFAAFVRDYLDPELVAYVEFSNEIWNFTFLQAVWARVGADERWGKNAADDSWMQYTGMRAAQMADIWDAAFGDQSERLVKVLATHTDWVGLEQGLFYAPLWLAEDPTNRPPVERFDAYAVAGYFGFDLGYEDGPEKVLGWLEDARANATAEGQELGYSRVRLRLYVEERLFEPAVAPAIAALRSGSLKELTESILPLQTNIANEHGLKMIMYEGGTHVVGIGEWSLNEDLSGFFQHLNYTAEMGELYQELLSGWRKAGGTMFNLFVDVASSSEHGSWGMRRFIEDENPRATAVEAYHAETPAWWEAGREGTFDHGDLFIGGEGADRLEGTSKPDILIGGLGDDILVANGRSDRLHGGKGRDLAMLPGSITDYTFFDATETVKGLVIASAGAKSFTLAAIEEVAFSDAPDATFALADFY